MTFFKRNLEPDLEVLPYNNNIESYRGLCALSVMLNHGTVHSSILVDKLEMPEFIYYLSSPYLSVLIFFCISGYAIGISNNKNDFNILNYLKRRAIRLYPILIVSILCCIIATQIFPWRIIIQNLLFLQNTVSYFGHSFTIFENFPIWSLNHEMLFYLLFIVIIIVKPRIWILLTIMIISTFVLHNSPPDIAFIPHYLNGFYFWLLGLFLAWGIINRTHIKSSKVNFISLAFLHLCFTHLDLGSIIMAVIDFKSNNNFPALFYLPFCLLLLGQLLGYENKFLKINRIACFGVPFLFFVYLIFVGRIFENERWIMCLLFWLIAVMFSSETKYSEIISKRLLFFGKISYAIYLFHIPVAIFVKNYVHISTLEIPIKYILWIAITLLMAYLFEIKLQHKIRYYFLKK